MSNFRISIGGAQLLVMAFGPCSELPEGWSLKSLQRQSDVINGQHPVAQAVGELLGQINVHEALAPNVAPASGYITAAENLTDRIYLGESCLLRNQSLPADGVYVGKKQAFVMSAAGCPVIIATASDQCVIAHASRDSLIDRRAVIGNPSREHLSVVHAIVAEFGKRRLPPASIDMVMLFAIAAEKFEHSMYHPIYGDYNHRLIQLVNNRWLGGVVYKDGSSFLDLEQVFVGQAREAGVSAVGAMGSLVSYPHLVQTCVGEDAGRRNLIVVRRDT